MRPPRFLNILVGLAVTLAALAIFPRIFGGPAPAVQALSTDALVFEMAIPLGEVKGRIDHMAVDVPRHHLFVAELGNDSVGVVDLAAHKLIARLEGFKEPQGIGYAAATDRLFIANGGNGAVEMRRGGDLSRLGVIQLGEDADNIRLDNRGRILVGYGDGGLAVLDPSTGAKESDIALAAHPEAFLAEPGSDRIFVNEPKALRIGVIDESSGKELARWSTLAAGNFPMALDAAGHRLFVVYRIPARIAAFDTQTGEVIVRTSTCGDADDVFYDPSRHRLYVSCGVGTIAALDAGSGLRERGRVQTRRGARTALFVPAFDRLYVAAPAFAHEPATILIYRPQ